MTASDEAIASFNPASKSSITASVMILVAALVIFGSSYLMGKNNKEKKSGGYVAGMCLIVFGLLLYWGSLWIWFNYD